MPSNSVKGFFLRVVIWLPVAFAVWFFLSIPLTTPLAWLVELIMTSSYPDAISSIDQNGYMLEVVTEFTPAVAAGEAAGSAMTGQIAFDVNPLMYGYSIPMLVGLLLASPGTANDKSTRLAIGLLVLFLVQTWGVCFHILKNLVFGLGPEIAAHMGTTALGRELLVLGFQLGNLILPTVTPIVLWMVLNRGFLVQLVPGLGASSSDPGRPRSSA